MVARTDMGDGCDIVSVTLTISKLAEKVTAFALITMDDQTVELGRINRITMLRDALR